MARIVGTTGTSPAQKRAPKAKPFVGFKPVSAPSLGQKKAQQKVNRAAAKLPQSKTALPAIPKLKNPTRAQRQEAVKLTSKAIQPKRLPGETAQHALTRLSKTGTTQVKGQTKQTTANLRKVVTPKQALALEQIASGPRAHAGPKQHKLELGGVNIGAGLHAVEKKLGTGLMPVVQTLRLAGLPGNVIAGAAEGKSPTKAIDEGTGFSDVLKHYGVKNKLVRGIAGTALDIGTDPTTYVTLGAGKVAEEAAAKGLAKKGGESLAEKGVSAGVKVHVPLTNKTFEAATSGKTSSKLLKTLSTPASRKVGSAAKEGVRPVAPDVTPVFRTAEQHATIRAAERRYRASVAAGERHISRRVQAYQKALKGEDQQGIIHSVERAPKNLEQYRAYEQAAAQSEKAQRLTRGATKARVKLEQIAKERPLTADEQKALGRARRRAQTFGQQATEAQPKLAQTRGALNANRLDIGSLPENARSVASALKSELEKEFGQKANRGIGAGQFKPTGPEDAQGYFPHVNTKEFEQGTKIQQRAFPTMRAKIEKGRGIRKPLAVANAETPGLFEENIPRALGQRLAKTNKSSALHDLWQHVASTGKSLTKDTPIDFEHERVYEVKPNGLAAIEDTHGGFDTKEAHSILEGKRKGHFVVLDKRSVADVERRLAASSPAESGAGRILDRTTGRLKYAATILNPSFQPRNLIGDSINAFMGDVHGKAFGQAAKVLRTERAENKFEKSAAAITGSMPRDVQKLLDRKLRFPGGDQSYGDLLEEARREGAIDTGQAGSELRNQLAQADASKLGKTYGIRAVNEYRENLPRLATYISAKARGMSASEAAAWSLKHHFDYADLSPTERNVLRRAFPFYTFFARNTRLQAEKLLTRPGKFATISKILNESAKLAGYQNYNQYASQLQQSQQQGLPIPLRIHGIVYNAYVSPPTTDLNQLTGNPSQQFFNIAQRLTFYKTIPELITNYSVFFRGQIQNPQAPLVPAPAPAANLPGPVKKLLGLTTYVDKRSGKRILGWPAKVDYAFRQITPDVNTVGQLATPVPGSRGMSQKTQAISGLTGIRIAPLDQNTNRINALYQQLNNATSQLDALNQRLGKTPDGHYPQPPESKRLRATIKTLNQKIGTLKSQRGDNPAGIATQQRQKASGGSALDQGSTTSTKSVLDAPTTTRSTSVLDR